MQFRSMANWGGRSGFEEKRVNCLADSREILGVMFRWRCRNWELAFRWAGR